MQPTQDQLRALVRTWKHAQGSHGGARVCARVLLGCYNGTRFPFDLTDLRLLDAHVLGDVFSVLAMDSSPQAEVHELLSRVLGASHMGARFELLACDWRLKHKCKKEEEKDFRERVAQADRAAAVRRAAHVTGANSLHHIDGNPLNNDPANLRLVAAATNAGATP